MRKRTLLLLAVCVVIIWACGSPSTAAQDSSIATKFVGKWKEQTAGVKEGATLNIASVDSATGQMKGKWIPPTGQAAGKEFDVIGWVSSAPPMDKLDNVFTVSFSVNLTTYGSITGFTGFLKDNKIIVLWHNVRPNSRYEWDHITANQAIFTRIS